MSYFAYKFLHLIGIFMVLFSLGSLIVSRAISLTEKPPWKRTLFWIMYGVVAITALLLVVIFGLLKAVFDPDKSASRRYSNEDDDLTQVEIDSKASIEGWISLDPKVAASFNAAEYYIKDNK